mgnify:CR=1 FL=1
MAVLVENILELVQVVLAVVATIVQQARQIQAVVVLERNVADLHWQDLRVVLE